MHARSPSERKITGLFPCGLRRITSSANHKNNATLPTNNSVRTRLFCGLGRRLRAFFRITSSITSSAVRTNGSIVYTAPTAAIFFLFAFSPLPRAGSPGLAGGCRSPLPAACLAHQGYPFAIRCHHQERSFLGGVRNRKTVLKHLDIAGLLSVEVLRRSHGDLQAEDRLQLADRLGVSIIDDERPQPLLEQVRILALRQVQLRVQGGASTRSCP